MSLQHSPSTSPTASTSASATASTSPPAPAPIAMEDESDKGKLSWADEVDDDDAKEVELDEDFEADGIESSVQPQSSSYVSSVVARVKKVGTSDSEGLAIKALSDAVVKIDRESQLLRKLVHNQAIKSAAALDMAAHNRLEIGEVRAIASHANRQYSKQLLEFSGDQMPERTRDAEADARAHLLNIIHQFFDLPEVSAEHIVNVHFLGRTRNMVARWSDFGPDSAFEAIIARSMSRGQRNVGVFARIAEAFCDGRISFLLRCCQRGGVVGPIHVTRSGKISARVKVGINSDGVDLYKPQMFETEADVRSIMNDAARDDEVKKDEGRATSSKRFTIQKMKAMAEHKMVYCNQAVDNIGQRARAAASTGTARLSGSQKLHAELRLERELRTVRPARPRPPITVVGAVPLRGQGRKRTRDTDTDEAADLTSDGAKRQQVANSRGRGGGRGGGRGRGRGRRGSNNLDPRSTMSQGSSYGSGGSNVNGFGGNIRGNRGNGRGSRGSQPSGSSFQQLQQQHQPNYLPPSMHQALIDSLPPSFIQQYSAWNGSEENPVNVDENTNY
jgi:hypothetical protein